MPYKDKAKQLECQRRSYHKNKERWKANRNPLARQRRIDERNERQNILASFPCFCCGNPDHNVIEWHHVYPEEKLFGIKEGASYSRERWWDEVMKCIPVCANCHTKIHKDLICLMILKPL